MAVLAVLKLFWESSWDDSVDGSFSTRQIRSSILIQYTQHQDLAWQPDPAGLD